ncbi:hypothetical protein GCM10017786_01250 [Amycolatopsis deserti]|uniref:Saccharopine dehydrogenase n=1 Tax=Amycolatopsis deserti TaxID=185696 RepID=A0ABQ3ICY5_9PSEU|nr:hypothetical protein [Amycolatopsis deserti]GHE76095.1 hypothetical protein GCM10017786_01250 [Amycolatopsis deserti]
MRALDGPGDVLVTTVGPVERFGHPVAAAAASVGAHYVDSTGEVGFARDLRTRHYQAARATGSTMLPAFGYDCGPITAISPVANLIARRPLGERIVAHVSKAAIGPAGGPDTSERAKTPIHVVARASDASGHVIAQAHVGGPSIYSLTGGLLAAAAARLVDGEATTADVRPLDAFGLGGLAALCAETGLRPVPR